MKLSGAANDEPFFLLLCWSVSEASTSSPLMDVTALAAIVWQCILSGWSPASSKASILEMTGIWKRPRRRSEVVSDL